MFSQSTRIMLISTALLAIATSPAIAGTVVVKKNGANPTIQDGVSAASAGDKVEIRSGTYQETVFINNTKDGLTLYAKGTVILDALPSGGVGDGPGIVVDADNVTLEGFTIRNARPYGESIPHLPGFTPYGYGVSMEADGLTLKKMQLSGNEDAGVIDNDHSDLTVSQCEFYGAGGDAVNSTGAGLMVKNSKFYGLGDGVYSEGSDATIKKCDFWAVEDGIDATGANVLIEDNKFRACYNGVNVDAPAGSGFTINNNTFFGCYYVVDADNADGSVQSQIKNNTISGGDDAVRVSNCSNVLIQKNRIEGVGDGLFITGGSNVIIRKNRVDGAEGYSIFISSGSDNTIDQNEVFNAIEDNGIFSSGENPTITDNVVDGTGYSGYSGIDVTSTTGGVVSGNVVKRILAGAGIRTRTSTSNLLIENNSVRWCGYYGFRIDGTNNTVSNNTARDCSQDGFHFDSSGGGHTISGNTSERNHIDGFDIVASNCLALDNVSEDNGAEGIEVNGDNNTIINNRSKRNRIDMANDGAGNSFSGNNYDTGDDATPPEID